MLKEIAKNPLFLLEALGVCIWWLVMKPMPLGFASWLGGALARKVGPLLPPHKIARRNLEKAFPEMNSKEIETVLYGMWDNLGRNGGEFMKLRAMAGQLDDLVEFEGVDQLDGLRANGGPAIFVSGHFANWEILGLCAARYDIPLNQVYRAPNNPLLSKLFQSRKPHPDVELIPKGRDGARRLMKVLQDKKFVGILIDQKLREGMAATFFGREAMTTTAPADLALRFDCPLIPIRIERTGGVNFKVTVETPAIANPDLERAEAAKQMTQDLNDLMESWVRARPEQWFWVHKRWRKDA